MPDTLFGPLLAFTDVEELVLAHYKHYLPMWLAARERKVGITPGSIARPRSYITKQLFTALPGQERTPIVIAVSPGFTTEPERRGTGVYNGLFGFGIAAVVMGNENVKARELAGHYQAALLGVALKHQAVADGAVRLSEFRDLNIEDIDEEAAGRSLAAVRMDLVYRVNHFVEDVDPPPYVAPPDDLLPQPDGPVVETVEVDVEKVSLLG